MNRIIKFIAYLLIIFGALMGVIATNILIEDINIIDEIEILTYYIIFNNYF